jgi:hypothetical protein
MRVMTANGAFSAKRSKIAVDTPILRVAKDDAIHENHFPVIPLQFWY